MTSSEKEKAKSRRWRANHPEYNKQYDKDHPDQVKKHNRRHHWRMEGIPVEEAEEVWKRARCDICGRTGIKMVVDHDHKTGKIRGLLCYNCNLAIGNAFDDIARLMAMIRYLETYTITCT